MTRLIIVGAGGFGKEVLFWAKQIQKENNLWEEIGFIDDNLDAIKEISIENRVISTIVEYEPQIDDYLICAIGDPKDKVRICNQLVEKGAKFTNLIHPTAVVAENAVLGTGVILAPYSIVSTQATIGNYVTLMSFSVIGHDVNVGNGCTICDHCNVMGNVSIDDNVFLGGSAAVIPNIHIQNNATVGAGSVVTRKVKSHTTVFGNPAVKVY